MCPRFHQGIKSLGHGTGRDDPLLRDSVNRFRFKACSKCRGDLVLDEGDWLCLQCGTYYYTDLYGETTMAPKPRPARNRFCPEPAGFGRNPPGPGPAVFRW